MQPNERLTLFFSDQHPPKHIPGTEDFKIEQTKNCLLIRTGDVRFSVNSDPIAPGFLSISGEDIQTISLGHGDFR
ncbi:MAG: hypothetical protein KKF12_15550, partial [Proteobacteria bacterium]|nr:hypothetical protein [Pseudomonadota bacterium]